MYLTINQNTLYYFIYRSSFITRHSVAPTTECFFFW